jgi:ribonuclease VapC
MIVDSSVLLSILFGESHAIWAADQLNVHGGLLRMSTVNLAEVLIRLRDRFPARGDEFELTLAGLGIEFVAPDAIQAQVAARARLTFPLNLGDCFVYALARVTSDSILTTDSDFRSLDVPVVSP